LGGEEEDVPSWSTAVALAILLKVDAVSTGFSAV
jgi:hypothetical protein